MNNWGHVKTISVANDRITTRSSGKIKFSSDVTAITRVHNSPLYRGMALWDKLPMDIQKLDSKMDFKRAIKNIKL